MSPDSPKIVDSVPPPHSPERSAGSSALAILLAAFAGTIALVWGFETNACQGFIAGAIAAVMRASFLALTHLPELALLVLIFSAHLGVGYLAARRRPFQGREELLTMVLPIGSFLLGLLVANTAWFASTCALHPWR